MCHFALCLGRDVLCRRTCVVHADCNVRAENQAWRRAGQSLHARRSSSWKSASAWSNRLNAVREVIDQRRPQQRPRLGTWAARRFVLPLAVGAQRAARWAPSFNRNATGVRTVVRLGSWAARRFVLPLAVVRTARPVGLRRLTATPPACAPLLYGWDLGRHAGSFCLWPLAAQRAARWAPSFNRNATGVRALLYGWELGRPAGSFRHWPSAHSARPVGLRRLTATPPACALLYGWELGRPAGSFRLWPLRTARPVGLRRLTATPPACATVVRLETWTARGFVSPLAVGAQRAARWACG